MLQPGTDVNGEPLDLQKIRVMYGAKKSVQDDKNLPIIQNNFVKANSNIGFLPGENASTNPEKYQQMLAAASQTDSLMHIDPSDPSSFTMMVMKSGGFNATNTAANAADRTDIYGTHLTNEDKTNAENADTKRFTESYAASAAEQKAVKNIGDTPKGFEQTAAVEAWNNLHPDEKLPVPDGQAVPWYEQGDAEKAIADQREGAAARNVAAAAFDKTRTKYYAGYIGSVIGKDNADAYMATQRGIAIPKELRLQSQREADQGAYRDGMLRLGQQRLKNTQHRMDILMQNTDYKELVQQDGSLRNQIDILNAQEGKYLNGLPAKPGDVFIDGTEKLKADLLKRQADVSARRSVFENDPQYSTPAAAPAAPTQVTGMGSVPQAPTPTGFQAPPAGGRPANGDGVTPLPPLGSRPMPIAAPPPPRGTPSPGIHRGGTTGGRVNPSALAAARALLGQ